MKKAMSWNIVLFILLFFLTFKLSFAQSDGILSPNQAAYDIKFYDLDLNIDPKVQKISGSLLCRINIINQIDTLELDLDSVFTIDSILICKNNEDSLSAIFKHNNGKIKIEFPFVSIIGDIISAKIFYSGSPRISVNPPWAAGFVWEKTSNDIPWIGVACEHEGGDIW